MTAIERDVFYHAGARFFEEDGEVMFQFQSDASSSIGPRKAKEADKKDHKGAWDAFNEGRLPQLDGDGDGRPGGSLPRRGRPPKPKD